ncbi:MAG: MarR family transcriptional regulator, partial [Thermomicrobiales bacterium]|nr:MarR family transcriptional regulator [Thermomicrobiales bacterium]
MPKLLVEKYNLRMTTQRFEVHNDRAQRLATAVSRLRTILRDARWQVTDLALTQVSILRTLEQSGSATAAELAVAEHVTPQAVAQQLKGLKERGYILTTPDPHDGRKTMISLSEPGAALLDELLVTREVVLARAIE